MFRHAQKEKKKSVTLKESFIRKKKRLNKDGFQIKKLIEKEH